MSQTAPFKTVAVATADPRVLRDAEAGSFPGVSPSGAEPGEGDILIEVSDPPRPAPLLLRAASLLSGWAVVANVRSAFEKEMRDAGWTLFFMAGEIKATAVGFDQSAGLKGGLTRLARKAKAQDCNALEITRIRRLRFLGVSRVSISAHVRHLQKGSVFFGR